MSYTKAGEILVRREVITRKQLDNALKIQLRSPLRVGELVVELGYATEDQVAAALGEQYDMEVVDPNALVPDPTALELVDAEFAKRRLALPYKIESGVVHIVIADPTDVLATDSLAARIKLPLRFSIAGPTALRFALRNAYRPAGTPALDLVEGSGPAKPATTQDDRTFLLLMTDNDDTASDADRKAA